MSEISTNKKRRVVPEITQAILMDEEGDVKEMADYLWKLTSLLRQASHLP